MWRSHGAWRWGFEACLALGLLVSACGRLGFEPLDDDAGSSGVDSTAAVDAVTDGDGGLGTTELSNVAPSATCTMFDRPSDQEHGYFLAVRLTPSGYPFFVSAIQYSLYQSTTQKCLAYLPHVVQIFKSANAMPAATPTVFEEIPVDLADTIASGHTLVQKSLSTPLRLDAGESVFVSIQLVGSGMDDLCVETCDSAAPGLDVDRNWFSNAAAPPFPWGPSVITAGLVSVFGSQ